MKIGIYSGSFNPIHEGHVALCDHLVRKGYVDQVWLIRSPLNPFKVGAAQTLAPDAHREMMLRIAVEGHEGLEVCTIEDQLPRPNYSINTFHALEAQYPQHEFHLIVGADNWLAFDKWRAYDEFLTRYHLIVYPRPGYRLTRKAKEFLGQEALERVRFATDSPRYNISSTEIRDAIGQRQEKPGLLDERVYAYIINNKLYLDEPK